ncbi:hypothetical protein [Cellulomonas xiejunii]|uniref:hypothetical protein n=1 Tax=Cellulomonas xiejunii TaxID=2968083 RepID=UPI001D0E3871|nr:hypothetical protein [Cellulomonas xiejunii]MCC2313972.1 hypothetical protein [Cellulomonas xiejunii]
MPQPPKNRFTLRRVGRGSRVGRAEAHVLGAVRERAGGDRVSDARVRERGGERLLDLLRSGGRHLLPGVGGQPPGPRDQAGHERAPLLAELAQRRPVERPFGVTHALTQVAQRVGERGVVPDQQVHRPGGDRRLAERRDAPGERLVLRRLRGPDGSVPTRDEVVQRPAVQLVDDVVHPGHSPSLPPRPTPAHPSQA